ncbi:DUF7289 family protein [Halalkalicoccus subterraneus]|uniref:DUF7289 family protein n=1 Tax=Halalkalicoccus subterraneus TaxID=2675002 RepID=UPI000EFC56C1|nr:hypothetical protein [Halalkalicoccus subterraneus]
MADRGVSEMVGFVLIFALVVTTLGVVYTAGTASLTDARDAERVNNAERAFDVLADDVEAITRRNAPSRATAVSLADAGLRVERGEEIRVSVGGEVVDAASGRLVYDSGTGSDVLYRNGAVLRGEGAGGSMAHRPSFVIGEERLVVRLVELYDVDATAVSGDRTVLVRAERIGTMQYSYSSIEQPVTIAVETEHERAWTEYFESRGGTCESNRTVECAFEPDELHVVRVDIGVRFS